MIEFIKSIFTTPINLWTLPQELFVMGVVFGTLIMGELIVWGVSSLVERIKYKGCFLRKYGSDLCNGDCKNCKHKK